MKTIKTLLASFFLLNALLLSAMSDEITEQELTEETSTMQDLSQPNEPIAQNLQLAEWYAHLNELLDKGMFWDYGNSVPTNDWKNKALDIAKSSIQTNAALADEIKESLTSTLTDKVTLENGTRSSFTDEFITNFNNEISTSPEPIAEKKEEIIENVIEERQEETPIVEQEIPQENTTNESESAAKESPQEEESNNSEQQWTNYMHDMEQNDYDASNIEEFINKSHQLAYGSASSPSSLPQKEIVEKLKNEFKDAIELQSKTKGFGGLNPDAIIAAFNRKLDESLASNQLPQLDGLRRNDPFGIMPQTEFPLDMNLSQKEDLMNEVLSEEPSASAPQEQTAFEQTITIPHYTPSIDDPIVLEKEKKQIEHQKSLKEALMGQIQQKEQLDAEKKEKQNIIASLMEKVFHVDISDWFSSHKDSSNLEIIPEIVETMLNKEKDSAQKNIKKSAYLRFQSNLLSFNTKEFWDLKNKRPKALWLDIIKPELATLITYKMITIQQALDLIDQTLKTNNAVNEMDRSTIINTLKNFLETIVQKQKNLES